MTKKDHHSKPEDDKPEGFEPESFQPEDNIRENNSSEGHGFNEKQPNDDISKQHSSDQDKSLNHNSSPKQTGPSERTELVEELEMQVAALTEALQRERADALNVRRRAEEEKSKLASYFKAFVLKALLPALDNIYRAAQHEPGSLQDAPKDVQEWAKGIRSIAKQFEDALNNIGVEKIATVGEVFDPNMHEAVGYEDGEGDQETVVEELQAGYRIGDEIIRPAMVRVKS